MNAKNIYTCKMNINNSIILYSSNPKIYKYNTSIYLRLRCLLDDSGSSVAQPDPTLAPA